MILHTDAFLKKGNKIIIKDKMSICEDYILHHNSKTGFKYVILSDGCSSSPQTDVGARILVHTAKRFLERTIKDFSTDHTKNALKATSHYYDLGYKVIHLADVASISLLGLHENSLDATLMILFECAGELWFYGYGDGYILMKEVNGKISYIKITCDKNTPNYLSYQLDPARKEGLLKSVNNSGIFIETRCFESDGEVTMFMRNSNYDYNRSNPPLLFKFPQTEYSEVLIASDGIGSFDFPDHPDKDDPTVMDFMNFKNTNGEFIKRRIGRVIKGYERKGYIHTDDISIGGFTIQEE